MLKNIAAGCVVRLARGRNETVIDVRSILGSLLEAGMTPSSSRRIDHAVGSPQLSNLGGMLGQLAGSARQAAGETKRQAQAGNPMAVGGLGALAGAILGGARGSSARGALGGAALAILGQVAYSALQGRLGAASVAPTAEGQVASGAESVPVGLRPPQSPAEEAVLDSRGLILLQAMISAAKADGQIDGREMERILSKLDEAGADQEAKDFVLAEMRRPLDVEALVAQADTPEVAAQVYAASLLAIEVDTPAEQAYLDRLAGALRLDAAARQQIHTMLGVGGTSA